MCGQSPSQAEVQDLLNEVRACGKGVINFQELLSLVACAKKYLRASVRACMRGYARTYVHMYMPTYIRTLTCCEVQAESSLSP